MRLASVGILLSLCVAQAACIGHPDSPGVPIDDEDSFGEDLPPGKSDQQQKPVEKPQEQQESKALGVIKEEVYVLMKDWDGDGWMCTGTLVAKDIVVTAAHCIDDSQFESFEIVAPFAEGKPRVNAVSPQRMSYDYKDHPASPDIGFLWLEQEIDLPQYAEFADVTERLEKGETLKGSVVVRSALKEEAAFKGVDNLDVKSAVDRGYAHGITTPFFSQPGDSGAGLFLIENGKVTHKLIGVERNPEEEEGVDHFTRVDPDFLQWFHDHTGGD